MMFRISACLLTMTLTFISASSELDSDEDLLCDETACDDYECPEIYDCEHGFVPDVCQCCYTCAKGQGEQCGGMFDLAGTCAENYACEPHPKYPQLPGICIKK